MGQRFGNTFGWQTFILPFNEQNNIHDQFDFSTSWTQVDRISTQPMANYRCPSDQDDGEGHTKYSGPNGDPNTRSSYVMSIGSLSHFNRSEGFFSERWGVGWFDTKTTFTDMRDGSSNILFIGERDNMRMSADVTMVQFGLGFKVFASIARRVAALKMLRILQTLQMVLTMDLTFPVSILSVSISV